MKTVFDDTTMIPGFVSVDEVPDELLDKHPLISEEGDDSRLANATDRGVPDLPHLSTLAFGATRSDPFPVASRARIVPLRRPLKGGMRGKDVIATKRALSHAGYLNWPRQWTPIAGPYWTKAVKKFQKNHELHIDGHYGLETHRKLVSLGHFDRYGALLMGQAPREQHDDETAARDRLEAIALYGYHMRSRIFYTQGPSRMTIVRRRVAFPWLQHTGELYEDCSSFDTGVYYTAKLPDPNHLGYNGQGYTGTLGAHGMQTVNVKRGDLAFYGSAPYRHVTMHVGHGTRCVSHGSSIGPLLVSTFRYRSDYHSSRSYV